MAVVGFEPTPPERLEPKSSALDRSATLPGVSNSSEPSMRKLEWRAKPAVFALLVIMAAVGFEPTPPKRLEPESSALDRSATLPGETNSSEPSMRQLEFRAQPSGYNRRQ